MGPLLMKTTMWMSQANDQLINKWISSKVMTLSHFSVSGERTSKSVLRRWRRTFQMLTRRKPPTSAFSVARCVTYRYSFNTSSQLSLQFLTRRCSVTQSFGRYSLLVFHRIVFIFLWAWIDWFCSGEQHRPRSSVIDKQCLYCWP